MKTIVEPKDSIAKLWGKQQVKETEIYRLMRYLLRVECDGVVLLHNTVTGQFVLLNDKEVELLSKLPIRFTEPMQELITYHFLVPQDYDEYRTVNQLRKICQANPTGNAINNYVILPTTYCNAHCFYCYENDYPHVHMTEETAKRVIEYIAEHRQGKTVSLSWFGGEPLIGIARIDQISQGLKDLGIKYTATMISNAYLFDELIIEKAVNLWKLRSVQITLDGPESIYNKVKSYINAEGSPFQKVLRNIDLLTQSGILVLIRLNVDFYNKDDIYTLIEDLGQRYSGNKNITVYVSGLFNNQGFEPIHHSQADRIELGKIIDDYTERLIELGLGRKSRKIPSLVYNQCMADDSHSIEIQPDGSFSRCEHENIFDSYGNLNDGIFNPGKLMEWKESIERSDQCSDCSMYPSCYVLRKCMNADEPCTEELRLKAQMRHIKVLCSVYHDKMEDNKNEKV